MKRLVSISFFVLFVFNARGQSGNEWIDKAQPYAKIAVGQDGLYRVSYNELQQAGFPVSGDPQNLQLFHRGVEQAIIVAGEGDGVLDPGDYIEFVGKKNDGTLDSSLYDTPDHQPHRYYNLYSDTTAYFLTYGTSKGKRMPFLNESPGSMTPENFHLAERMLVLIDNYSAGIDYGNVLKTVFDAGEGWTGRQISQGQELTYTLEGITQTAPASGKPLLEVLLTGRGSMFHNVDLYSGSRLAGTVEFDGYNSYRYTQEIEWSDISGDGKLMVKLNVPGATGPDRVSAGYVRLLFPQQLTMTGAVEKTFRLDPNVTDACYLQIQNAPAGVRLFDITDPSRTIEIAGTLMSTLDVVVPAGSSGRVIYATTHALTPASVKRVSFRNIQPGVADYVIITDRSLRRPAAGYTDPVKAIAEYRSLPEGGGFDTLIVNIDQLYDQFNYGEQSPRAIFQFMKFLASGQLPEYLFLVGKGLTVDYWYYRAPQSFSFYRDLVPTAGFPASDMAFTAGLGGTPGVPGVATGRLSANTPEEVAAYFNKVKERDAQPFDNLNRKKILHLSGGIEENEPVLFRQILADFQEVAEDLYLGGKVQPIAKRSTEIKLVNIAEEVNAGLGLITFFGHSAPNTLDFDIGRVTDPVMGYNNPGKYPFLLMNGCDAGSFFHNTAIPGENWTTTANKGAVGFIAHSSYGLVTGLQRYSSTFYNVAFGDSVFIKQGVGKVQQEVSRRFLENFGTSALAISQVQQMVLLGDPAVRIFGARKPDYAPAEAGLSVSSFNGEPITALTDSFRIHVPIRNFGLARPERMRINIRREFNGGQVIEYDTIVPTVLYADTISMMIRNPNGTGYGINRFTVHVDADNIISELNEENNIVSLEYFIPQNTVRNLFPYNYSIVHDREVPLSFQYTDVLSGARDYELEIDTTDTFDSGFKKIFVVNTAVLGRQRVTLLEEDSLVYYWRVRIQHPLENESRDWAQSSFTFIDGGSEGWAQMHFPQYDRNETVGLVKDPELRRLKFQETVSDIAIRTFSSSSGKPQDSISFKVNGVEFNLLQEGGACRTNTINLVAFDRKSTQPYAGLYFKWYESGRRLLCGREPYVINNFYPSELVTGQADDLIQYVDNIATGDSVVLFNIGNAGYQQWPQAALDKLSELGISATQVADLQDGEPVVIFARKGLSPGAAQVLRGASPAEFVSVKRTITGRFTSGVMSSRAIGPALRWDRFIPRVREVEGTDKFRFSLVGITANGQADTLKTNVHDEEDLSFINAEVYPQIKVVFESEDDINLTSVQLAQWMVLYEPVAEGMVIYNGSTDPQVVVEGEPVSRDFGFVNISDKSFPDSLTVRYDLVNHGSGGSPVNMKIKAPAPGDTTVFTVPFSTLSKGGLNNVEVFINPHLAPEQMYDNNMVVLNDHVNVLSDLARPVVEVTIDGRQLHDDDYVSANPAIEIRLWDENDFLLKMDTVDVKIFLAFPCEQEECPFTAIYLSREDVKWYPATDTSDFRVSFLPRDLADGSYTLRVEAADARGNNGGEIPYQIRFRVESNESITVSSAYPNPFGLETNVEVTVTGESNNNLSYRFMVTSMNGVVVTESGRVSPELHVGRNVIHWNGRRANGERLPDGMYFYRLLIRTSEGEKEYFGKLLLWREL